MARVLVIDDEPLVAAMIQRTLEDDHEVVVQHSAEGALEVLERNAAFDAIITDLQMPGLDGIALRDELLRRFPALVGRLLFLSGGATSSRNRSFLSDPGIRTLEKPFRADELARRVREICAA